MLLSKNFTRLSKKINFTVLHKITYDKYVNAKHFGQYQTHVRTLKNDYGKSCVLCSTTFGTNETTKSLNYSTNPIEIPPPPPETEIFGTIGGLNYEKVDFDENEIKEEERLKTLGGRVPRKLKSSPGEMSDMMKNYISKGDIESAERVITECRKNHDKPTKHMLELMMYAFALQGDVVNSFKYYNMFKTLNYKARENTFTTLLNACSNSPNSTKALKYLEKSMDQMKQLDIPLNHAHYNVIVKAYGRHNMYDKALVVFQEMMNKKMKIGVSTLNSLMYAANSNVESGLKDILHIWHLMKKLNVPPNIFTYHLLLRGIRETNFGKCSIRQLLLKDSQFPAIFTDDNRPDLLMYPPVISNLPLKNIHNEQQLLLESPESDTNDSKNIIEKKITTTSIALPAEIENLNLDAVLKQNKLILFGGVEGFLDKMKNDRLKPTVKTISYLIQLVPDSVAAENMIINYARTENVELDIDFFNILIKKRALRGSKNDAKAVLDDISLFDLKPNIVTYGVLALACDTKNNSVELLKAMRSTRHTINKFIADALLSNAFLRRDFKFILELMEMCRIEQVRLDDSTYEKLDEFKLKMSGLVKRKSPIVKSEYFKAGFAKFNLRYKTWQEDMNRKIITERESKEKKKINY